MHPAGVAAFLLLSQVFPRSVAFGCRRVHEEIDAIDRELGLLIVDGPSLRAGALASRLRYTRIQDLAGGGMLPFLRWVEQECDVIGDGLRRLYFEGSWPEPARVAS